MTDLSARLREIVDALPLDEGMRVIEIGCGPGAAAREVANRVGPTGHVLAVDRSQRAIDQVVRGSRDLISSGRLGVMTISVEDLVLDARAQLYDLAFAVRVGAFDGRHPDSYEQAVRRVAGVLVPGGRLFIDGGSPLRELELPAQVDRPRTPAGSHLKRRSTTRSASRLIESGGVAHPEGDGAFHRSVRDVGRQAGSPNWTSSHEAAPAGSGPSALARAGQTVRTLVGGWRGVLVHAGLGRRLTGRVVVRRRAT